jgi:hypothetical protein
LIVLGITVVLGLIILAVILVATLLTSSYALHVTNQTAIMDPTITGVTSAIQTSTSLTNTKSTSMTQIAITC